MEGARQSESALLRTHMAAYQRGDAESFDRLYRALAPRLRGFLLAQSRDAGRADDLLQETFLHLHRARHTYDPALPLEPWAFAIARHVFLMDRRKSGRRHEVALADAALDPGATVEATELARHELERALASLTPERRGAVLLHHHLGFSFDEIGARLGIRSAAARLRASRGIRILRELLRGRRR